MSSPRLRILSLTHVLPDRDRAAAYSPPPSLPDDGLVELSFMEVLFVNRVMPMRRLFFYEGPGVPAFPCLVRSLRSSLAVALALFPPLSGKLAHRPSAAAGDVVVDCSPAAVSSGVKFVEAEYGGGIEDMRRVAGGGSDEGDREALAELGPELDATRLPAPVLAVQVTRPAVGRAAVVAVALHHAVADGHSAWQFMRAWAALSRMEVSPSRAGADLAPPAFDRTPLRYPEADELARKILRTVAPALPVISSSSSCLPPDCLRRTFLIHAGEIQLVKQHIRAQSQTTGEQADKPPSTYLAVSSLVWTSVARAKFRDLAGGDANFLVPVDFRRRLGSPIDERYFGDCVVPCVARAAVRDLLDGGGAGLARAAAAIRDAIRVQPECPVRAMEAWLESLRTVPRVRERFTFTGSSNRFMAYETDFGWGAPSRVELLSLFAMELVLLLGAQDGGVQVTATLRPEHMEAFASNLGRFSGRGDGRRLRIGRP
ncbi:hypothetical protein SETIT_4G033600v2 [Setaria italica]|uniref:Uncharacterized protein n=1 Tax=Setaria italica TaxID=4555 RepID=A0A368QQQ5_SETIT|nr:anthocyanidin 3-O-glucoside 6''-O-acyltransferase [Setaria italica]RCV20154.1 hypothetical protein SETIT_4G033600v2 [Setaria italica]